MNAASPVTPYDMIGGDEAVVAIVGHFYDLVEKEAEYAALRALHAADLGPVRHSLERFLTGWLGGPRDWFERGTCIMSMHRAFPITPAIATQWSDAMGRAIIAYRTETPALDADLAERMAEKMGHMAQGMINLAAEKAEAPAA